MPPPDDLEERAERLLQELFERFPLAQPPRLVWKNLRVSAGIAYYRAGAIALSRIVLTTEERMRGTLIHEYAHLLAVHRSGQKGAGHGEPWKLAMRDLGEEPRVRHTYEVRRNTKRQAVAYRCKKCGVVIQRSRRLPRHRKYVHAQCGGGLKLEAVLVASG